MLKALANIERHGAESIIPLLSFLAEQNMRVILSQ
jgi:hypothetical protein